MAEHVHIEREVPAVERIETQVPGQVFLQPVAAPSILGLFGFAGATFMVSAHMAGWYGNDNTPMLLFPFVALFGGLAQFLAGMWAYKARDGLATAMHGTWGSFWMAYGFLYLLATLGYVTFPAGATYFPELGFWFIVLAVTTWAGTWAAFGENASTAMFLVFLAAGSTLSAIGYMFGLPIWNMAAAYCFIVSAILAWYTATALMLNSTFGREVLSLGKFARAEEKPPPKLPSRANSSPLAFSAMMAVYNNYRMWAGHGYAGVQNKSGSCGGRRGFSDRYRLSRGAQQKQAQRDSARG
jgi:succinate-acetate transporter protein